MSWIACGVVLVVAWATHVLAAWWSPLALDDWTYVGWAESGGLGAHLAEARTTSDVLAYALVTTPRWVHPLVTPLATLALILLAARVALRRPLDWRRTGDLAAVLLVGALVWLAAPRVGLVLYGRAYAARHVYGAVLVLALLVPYLDGRPRGDTWWRVAGMAALGVLAAATTRHVAAPLVVALAWMTARHGGGARWMYAGLGGALAGTALVFLDAPFLDFARLHARAMPNTDGLWPVYVGEAIEPVVLVFAIALGHLVVNTLRNQPVVPADPGEARRAIGWLVAAFVMGGVALAGPRWGEPSMFAPGVALAIGAAPLLLRLGADRLVRGVLIALVAGTFLVVAVMSVPRYHAGRARVDAGAPVDGANTWPDFWWPGDPQARRGQGEPP